MAVDIFLVLPTAPIGTPSPVPLTGETVQDDYFGQVKAAAVVQIRSFSVSAENPTSPGSATGGAGAGKVVFNALHVEKNVDRVSPSLFEMSASGAHFQTVQIFVRRSGTAAAGKPHLGYEFATVFVKSIGWSGDDGDEGPVEQLQFAYAALAVGYYPQQPDGSFGKLTKLGWSAITNTQSGAEALTTF